MNHLLLFITSIFLSFFSFGQCTDLFFSEYIEGSSNNKAVEIFNPTPNDIDLSDYVIYRNNNGAIEPSDSLFPLGILASGDVFVITNATATLPPVLAESDTTHSLTFYNGDDAVWLKKISSGDTLDIIGEIGVDPGSAWTIGSGSTQNYTLIRKPEINRGQTDWAIAATEWDVFPIDMADSLGAHHISPLLDTIFVTACETYTSPSGDYVWTETGIYTDFVSSVSGCDSLITIDLTVLNTTGSFFSVTACDSYTSPSGDYTWTTSGIRHDTIPNHLGCDSIIVVNLTIKYNSTFYFETTACGTYTSPSGDYTWTTSGLYHDTIPNHVGCDSLLIIDLTVLPVSENTLFASACKYYISPSGHIWTSGGTYTDTLTNELGCDSIITINLTIYNVDVTVTQDENELEANNAGAFYQWLDCNDGYAEIAGENNQLFVATENGSYAVEIFQDGCRDTSDCYIVEGMSLIEQNANKSISIYPNPTSGHIYINLNTNCQKISVKSFDFSGKIIQNECFTNTQLVPFKVSNQAGVYWVEIVADDLPPKRIIITQL